MKRSESEILRDPDIWNLTESDDEDADGKDTARSPKKLLSNNDSDEIDNDDGDL